MIMASENTHESAIVDDTNPQHLSSLRHQVRSGENGLACPKCACRHVPDENAGRKRRASEVTHSEDIPDRIRRRRVCRACGYRFTTVEILTRDASKKDAA